MLYLFYLIEICWLLWRWICQKRLRTVVGLRAPEWTSIMFNCEGSPGSSTGNERWPVSRKGVVHHDTHFNASVNLTTLFACAAAFHTSLQMDQGEKVLSKAHSIWQRVKGFGRFVCQFIWKVKGSWHHEKPTVKLPFIQTCTCCSYSCQRCTLSSAVMNC